MIGDRASTGASPEEPRLFYGWWLVVTGGIAQFFAAALGFHMVGIFLEPMVEDLDWSRSQYITAISIGTAFSGVVSFLVGPQIDRHGARPLMLIGTAILGTSLLLLAHLDALWQFILLRGFVFTLGFTLIGFLVVNTMLSKWFVERRGLAIAIASLGLSLSGILTPLVLTRVVDSIGWRDTWTLLGVVTMLVMFPVALCMRRAPEHYGLLPDGQVVGAVRTEKEERAYEAAQRDYERSFTVREALRTPAMWLLVFSTGCSALGMTGVVMNSIPFLTDHGFTRTEASVTAAVQGVAALCATFAWGWAIQQIHPRWLGAGVYTTIAVAVTGIVIAAQAESLGMVLAGFALWGVCMGGMMPINEFIWSSYFGRRYIGAVRGTALPVSIMFSALGPLIAGTYFDAVGSYDGAILTFCALWGVAALLVLLARPPTKRAPAPRPAPALVAGDDSA